MRKALRLRRFLNPQPEFTALATHNEQLFDLAGIVRALRRQVYRIKAQIRVMTMTKKEEAELLEFLAAYSTKEACDAEQYRTYCEIFAAKRVFSCCPDNNPDRLLFFEKGEYFLPPDEEDEARRRACSPLDDGEWFPTCFAPFKGYSGEKATDEQILRVLYLRSKFDPEENSQNNEH